MFSFNNRYRDKGLLILRVGIGISFMFHGYPKLAGGPEKWAKLGKALTNLTFDVYPTFWGFMAAISEFFGGLLLALGLFTHPACFFLLCTVIVAALMHITRGDSFGKFSHALEAAILFLSLLFIGPGKYSLDERLVAKRKKDPHPR